MAKVNILQNQNLEPYSIIKTQEKDLKDAKKYVNVVLSSKKSDEISNK